MLTPAILRIACAITTLIMLRRPRLPPDLPNGHHIMGAATLAHDMRRTSNVL